MPGSESTLSAREAAELLGVKRATLYAYAARGRLESLPGPGRERRYRREDLLRLKARRDARASDAALATGALRFGAPVVETELTEITAAGPRYRGRAAVALAGAGASLEEVAEWLWSGAREVDAAAWREPDAGFPLRRARGDALDAVRFALAALDVRGAPPTLSEDGGLARARALVRRAAAAPALTVEPARVRAALGESTVARVALLALAPRAERRAETAVDAALVLAADHELNASAFTARVVASTGADLLACVNAAACALSGPRHGGACARVEALLDEASALSAPGDVVAARAARGEPLPGFGHPLYPGGDPRGVALLDLAAEHGGRRRTPAAIADAMADAQGPGPTLDFGLVALADALDLPRGSAGALFAIGRTVGWIAHALEQRRQGFLLRPTARYVGA